MADKQKRILVVNDEPSVAEFIDHAFVKDGCMTDMAACSEEALVLARNSTYDLFILDIMLPGINGFDLCRRIRGLSNAPMLFLASRDTELEQIVSLKIDGDDFLTKPFGKLELIARARALLRRAGSDQPGARTTISLSGLTLDVGAYAIIGDKGGVNLTPLEFKLMFYLMKNAGRVVSREDLLRDVWGWKHLTGKKTVDVHIRRLRVKIEEAGSSPKLIEAMCGVGYRYVVRE